MSNNYAIVTKDVDKIVNDLSNKLIDLNYNVTILSDQSKSKRYDHIILYDQTNFRDYKNTKIYFMPKNDIYNIDIEDMKYLTSILYSSLDQCKKIVKDNRLIINYSYVIYKTVDDIVSFLNYDISDKTIQVVMIIKNGVDTIKSTLESYFNIVDEFTILDTGSTDGTQDLIRETLKDKKFKLIEEHFPAPFRFDIARNIALDLSNKKCTYTIMPDDSYIIYGENIRSQILSLNMDYYLIEVKSELGSQKRNIIWKTSLNKKYLYPVHEIIDFEDWLSGVIINGYMSDKINTVRTYNRLNDDYILLKDYLKNDPTDARVWYYLAQTTSLLKLWEEAYDCYSNYFECNPQYKEEIFNAYYRRALIAEFNLKRQWYLVLPLYIQAYEYMPYRAEPIFSIAEYYININPMAGYLYIKRATEIPIPNAFNSFDPFIYLYHIPRLYAKYCILLKMDGGLQYAKKAYNIALKEGKTEWIKDMEGIISGLIMN